MVNKHFVVAYDTLAEGAISTDHSYVVPSDPKKYKKHLELVEQGRQHWERFHNMDLTPESLELWEQEIPNFDCTCKADYLIIKTINPPRFDDQDRWKWEVHNSVNEKLHRSRFPWEEYYTRWPKKDQSVNTSTPTKSAS